MLRVRTEMTNRRRNSLDSAFNLRENTLLANAARQAERQGQTLPLFSGSISRPTLTSATDSFNVLPRPALPGGVTLIDTTQDIVNESAMDDTDPVVDIIWPAFPPARRACADLTDSGETVAYFSLHELYENDFFLPEFPASYKYFTVDTVSLGIF